MPAAQVSTALVLLALLGGCASYTVPRYAVSVDNVTALRSLQAAPVRLSEFTGVAPDALDMRCRGNGLVRTPDGDSFAGYVRKALYDELRFAQAYDNSSPVVLSGHLKEASFDSIDGTWKVALALQSASGPSLTVNETYRFSTSFVLETACTQTAQAWVPAVQNLIARVTSHPDFARLVAR